MVLERVKSGPVHAAHALVHRDHAGRTGRPGL